MNRNNFRAAALLLLVFAAGAFSGGAIQHLAARTQPSGMRVTMGLPDILDRLNLSADQRHSADSILNQSTPRSEAVMREIVPRLAAIADSARADLRRVLTPTQQVIFDSATSASVFLLKRKLPGGGTRIDTVRKQ